MSVNAMSERTTSASWAMGIVKALEMDGLDCRVLFKQPGPWSVLRMSCKPRFPVGLVKQPEQTQVRITISHSLPKS